MAKKVKKRGKVVDMPKKENEGRTTIATDHAVSLIAAIIVLVASIIFLTPWKVNLFGTANASPVFGIIGIILGLGMLIATLLMRRNPREASVFVLVFSIIALILPPSGFVIGPIMGIIGSVLVLAKVRR